MVAVGKGKDSAVHRLGPGEGEDLVQEATRMLGQGEVPALQVVGGAAQPATLWLRYMSKTALYAHRMPLGARCVRGSHTEWLRTEPGLFQGCEPPDTDTLRPKKTPCGRERHFILKTINQVISKVRVTVEHGICGVKRCHIGADIFRNRR